MADKRYLPRVTIVIKCLNEADCLKKLLPILFSQDYPRELVEIIVIDNQSTDDSRGIAKSFGVDVVVMPRKEFTYPKVSNLGCQKANGDLVVFLSAHSYPLNNQWLSKGVRHFERKEVVGVFCWTLRYVDSGLTDSIFYLPGQIVYRLRHWLKPWKNPKLQMGLLGFTNAIIRKSSWEEHHFDESLVMGGEDTTWGLQRMSEGYQIIFEPYFAVRHAHYLNPWQLMQQIWYWAASSRLWQNRKFSLETIIKFRPQAKRYLK